MPIREELFTHKIACPMGASLEDQAIVDRWQFLRDYCFADEARKGNWGIILKLSARRTIEQCNMFIYLLTTDPLAAEDSGYSINEESFNELMAPIIYDETLNSTEDIEFNSLIATNLWLKAACYSGPEARHILYNLMIYFNNNGESGLARLKFYHDHHRLSALIEYIKEGRLSITEAAQYDKFECDEIPPRMLPRLLAGDLDEGITLSQDQIVAYELHDYVPKNNPHRHELLTEEAYRPTHPQDSELSLSYKYKTYTMTHARDDQHIATYFDTILKPVVAERARLYLDLQKLKKQEEELSQGPLTWPQWFYYLFYKTPTQECVLVSAKIALFSGAIEGMQQCIRAVENLTDKKRVAGSTSTLSVELSSNDSTYLYVLGNSRPDALTLYANSNYLKENFGANAIESTQFRIGSRNHSVSKNISKYAVDLEANKKLSTHSVVMLKEEDAEPTSCDKGIIQIKICSANPEKVSVYWTEGQTLVKKTFKSSALFDEISNNLPKPGESSNNPILHQKISTICDYNCEERWLTREKPTVNYARDHVATFFKGLIGAIFCIPVGVIGLACPSFANSFNAIFFGTRSLNCLKQAETARETLKKQMSVDLSVEYP